MGKKIVACALLCSVIASPASAATFIGDSFEGSYRFPRLQRATIEGGNAVISPVGQFTFLTGRINPTARISESNVLITFAGDGTYKSAEFNGILLRNLSRSNIAGFLLDPSTTLSGFDQSRLSFTPDSLLFNFEGLSIRAVERVSAKVLFVTTSVPEPTAWTFMILGFGAMGFALRRRSKGTVQVRLA